MFLDALRNNVSAGRKVIPFPQLPAGLGNLSSDAPARYERKFAITALEQKKLSWLLRINPALFTSIYQPRIVNNIYLDTPDRQFYKHNVDGVALRMKVRIRWYGGLVEALEDPQLELKIKSGLAGWKLSYPLRSMLLEEALEKPRLIRHLERVHIPASVLNFVKTLEPTLLNRYHRTYHLSGCKNFRATVDSDLQYARTNWIMQPRLRFAKDEDLQVLELKYLIEQDEQADHITSSFPFRVSRNSKYVRGLLMVGLPEGAAFLEGLQPRSKAGDQSTLEKPGNEDANQRVNHLQPAQRSRKSRREPAKDQVGSKQSLPQSRR